MATLPSRFVDRLNRKRILILDGALATELERSGHDLDHPLWSAAVLREDPDAIERVHRSYLEAGADVLVTSGYQASVPGLRAIGLEEAEARELYLESFRIAVRSCDGFDGQQPLIAASIGPYGAFLADGSEYRGNYGVAEEELEQFHRERMDLIANLSRSGERGPDLFAFETLPSLNEALVLARTLESYPDLHGWVSFSCSDDAHTCEGQAIEECARALADFPQVIAIGVNCTSPEYVPALIRKLNSASSKPLLAYPNSGESYDEAVKCWTGRGHLPSPDKAAADWVAAGASIVGGCCRTTPADIAAMVRWRDGLTPGTLK